MARQFKLVSIARFSGASTPVRPVAVRNGLAVTPCIGWAQRYRITHIKTGRAIGIPLTSYQAVCAMRQIAGLCDWATMTHKRAIKSKRLKAAVYAVFDAVEAGRKRA